jgi:hypothetical protein
VRKVVVQNANISSRVCVLEKPRPVPHGAVYSGRLGCGGQLFLSKAVILEDFRFYKKRFSRDITDFT